MFQLGCSSITQIQLPIQATQNENGIKSLNDFGENLSSTIYLVNSLVVETYWLSLREDEIYFLAEETTDTASVHVEKVKTVKFNNRYTGCLSGGLLGLCLGGLGAVAIFNDRSLLVDTKWQRAIIYSIYSVTIGFLSGFLFFGQKEFNFIRQ